MRKTTRKNHHSTTLYYGCESRYKEKVGRIPSELCDLVKQTGFEVNAMLANFSSAFDLQNQLYHPAFLAPLNTVTLRESILDG